MRATNISYYQVPAVPTPPPEHRMTVTFDVSAREAAIIRTALGPLTSSEFAKLANNISGGRNGHGLLMPVEVYEAQNVLSVLYTSFKRETDGY